MDKEYTYQDMDTALAAMDYIVGHLVSNVSGELRFFRMLDNKEGAYGLRKYIIQFIPKLVYWVHEGLQTAEEVKGLESPFPFDHELIPAVVRGINIHNTTLNKQLILKYVIQERIKFDQKFYPEKYK